MARNGKIARLPAAIREELNKRIRDNQQSPEILPWLNGLPETRQVLTDFFDGVEVNPQNLSDWRGGGYKEWLDSQDRRHARLENIKALSSMSMKLAEANGGNLSEGAASILGGSILEMLEQIEALKESMADAAATPEAVAAAAEAIDNLTNAVVKLRRGDHDRELLRQNEKKLAQKDKDLALAQAAFDQKLQEYQDKVAAQKRQIEDALTGAKRGGITTETLAKIEEAARLL